jgi:cyclic pyranopterin phosphate synthase
MPEEGVKKLKHVDILTVEEIEEVATSAASLGIKKIRLTGGEPLVRKGILGIVERITKVPGITEVTLTTNGTLLQNFALDLREAGLARINISIDSVDRDNYKKITRIGDIDDVFRGIEAAKEAGFMSIKLNTVLIKGMNDNFIKPLVELSKNDICVRFIEIMPMGQCAVWNKDHFISVSKVLEEVPELEFKGREGVSNIYKKPGYKGTVGLISPISNHFCPTCNKLRVTADGKLKLCLHSDEEVDLRGLHGEELTEVMRKAILTKPFKHKLEDESVSHSCRGMNAIGG